jgi:predicted XRE-type DNA-binding protein
MDGQSSTRNEPSNVDHNRSALVHSDMAIFTMKDTHRKIRLASRIAILIQDKGLTQIQATEVLGIPQPKLSLLLRGQCRKISEAN